jgi:thiol-disulfide isomerase/thioredoxin
MLRKWLMIIGLRKNLIGILVFSTGIFHACQDEVVQDIPQMHFNEFETFLQKSNDTVYIINFWATWCKPCLKELPDFERIREEYSDHKVEVILVSLDFPAQYENVLVPFVAEKELRSKVIQLIDVDANKWIGKVSEDWSGAIPATLVYKGSDRSFHESVMTYEQLKSIVESKL